MARKGIHNDGKGTQFSKKNQPTPEKKSAGWKRKLMLKELLNICINGNDAMSKELRKSLAKILKIPANELKAMTFEEAMDLSQIQRAMHSTKAWKDIKEVVYGQKHEINGDMNIKLKIGFDKEPDVE